MIGLMAVTDTDPQPSAGVFVVLEVLADQPTPDGRVSTDWIERFGYHPPTFPMTTEQWARGLCAFWTEMVAYGRIGDARPPWSDRRIRSRGVIRESLSLRWCRSGVVGEACACCEDLLPLPILDS